MKSMVLEHFESENVNYGSEDTISFVVINVAIAHVERGIGPDHVSRLARSGRSPPSISGMQVVVAS